MAIQSMSTILTQITDKKGSSVLNCSFTSQGIWDKVLRHTFTLVYNACFICIAVKVHSHSVPLDSAPSQSAWMNIHRLLSHWHSHNINTRLLMLAEFQTDLFDLIKCLYPMLKRGFSNTIFSILHLLLPLLTLDFSLLRTFGRRMLSGLMGSSLRLGLQRKKSLEQKCQKGQKGQTGLSKVTSAENTPLSLVCQFWALSWKFRSDDCLQLLQLPSWEVFSSSQEPSGTEISRHLSSGTGDGMELIWETSGQRRPPSTRRKQHQEDWVAQEALGTHPLLLLLKFLLKQLLKSLLPAANDWLIIKVKRFGALVMGKSCHKS